MRRFLYIIVVSAVFLLLLLFFGGINISPAMQVNGHYIKSGDYHSRLSGFEFYGKQTSPKGFEEEAIRKGVIMSLIIDKLVEFELEARDIEKNEADKRIEAVLSEESGDIEKAASEFYGWDIAEFKKFVLLPQARQDILSEVLREEGGDFNEWLNGALVKADVKIYSLPYEWIDGVLVKK
ncbi:MAG: hypothetical protein HYW09_01025 [Candidatus Niyogibacteria bacterium]|nr:hypothetical protein [Candidatus Niyogibacteria bacterium]